MSLPVRSQVVDLIWSTSGWIRRAREDYLSVETRRFFNRCEFEMLRDSRDLGVIIEDFDDFGFADNCIYCFCQHLFGGFYASSDL